MDIPIADSDGARMMGLRAMGYELLAGQRLKDKWESRTGYIWIYIYSIVIRIIRRDGSGTVVPIRIRTDSEPVA